MSSGYVPARGDLVWLNFDPQAGHEQSGRRPAVVLSPVTYNRKVGLGLFCPVTSKVKGFPYESLIPPGMPVSGAVLSDQVKNLDWRARRADKIGALPDSVIDEILANAKTLL
jgi:mRNA interferase MazF